MWPRVQAPPSGWYAAAMRSWVASITSGRVMDRLKTWTGRIVLTNSCTAGSWLPMIGCTSSRLQAWGTILSGSNSHRRATATVAGRSVSPSRLIAASCTRSQSPSDRKLARVSEDGVMSSLLRTSPRSRRQKISDASRKMIPFIAGQAASSTTSRGTMPDASFMNWNRPAAKPTWMRRASSGSSPWSAANTETRSA